MPGHVSEIMDLDLIDEAIAVPDEAAADTTREVNRATGLLAGHLRAAAYAARLLARRERWTGSTIVTVFPDTGERYLSLSAE